MKNMQVEFELDETMKKERQKMFENLLQQPEIKQFIQDNNVDENYIYQFTHRFHQWLLQNRLCIDCPGIHACRQPQRGQTLDLVLDNGIMLKEIKKCHYLLAEEAEMAHLSRFLLSDMPKQWASYSVGSINLDQESDEYVLAVSQIDERVLQTSGKGFYLYGKAGVGKTYLLACAANDAARAGLSVAFVHVPTLIGRLKSYLDNRDEFEAVLNKIKQADIVYFDDIGAESVTSWVRDELLLPLINDRCERSKSTWFTSNLDVSTLTKHYEYNQKGEKEEIKAQRLAQRIETVSDALKIKGFNRRR